MTDVLLFIAAVVAFPVASHFWGLEVRRWLDAIRTHAPTAVVLEEPRKPKAEECRLTFRKERQHESWSADWLELLRRRLITNALRRTGEIEEPCPTFANTAPFDQRRERSE